ncbi:hypothetical protein [Sphingomicrobium nitratireducens]|uniref:hypothetical protein n=1 Tax=Sphingomicrobium nitratireducens TaxID=2964666 RepID=UPI00223F292A|nr:hypothetical protein [Sphingomicrobium nitratireducens]
MKPDDIARLITAVLEIADQSDLEPTQVVEFMVMAAGANFPESHAAAGYPLPDIPKVPTGSAAPDIVDFVDAWHHLRMQRNDLVGANLFRDPAWDMLQEIFVHQLRGHRLAVSNACDLSGVPQSTALRHLHRLEEKKLVIRRGDPTDNRRAWVECPQEVLDRLLEMNADLMNLARRA